MHIVHIHINVIFECKIMWRCARKCFQIEYIGHNNNKNKSNEICLNEIHTYICTMHWWKHKRTLITINFYF